MNQWGKLLWSGIDGFDAAAGWRRSADLRGVRWVFCSFLIEKLTFLWGARTWWKIPCPKTNPSLEEFGGSSADRPWAVLSRASNLVEATQVWTYKNIQPTQIPPLFLQKLHFLQTSVRSRGQCAALSLFLVNLIWDLLLVKRASAFTKPNGRRPLLSVCFHPCLGNTMNADVVGNFWLSIGFFCENFKDLWLVIFWDF